MSLRASPILVAKFMPRFIEEKGEEIQLTGKGNSWEGSIGLTKKGRSHLVGRSAKRPT